MSWVGQVHLILTHSDTLGTTKVCIIAMGLLPSRMNLLCTQLRAHWLHQLCGAYKSCKFDLITKTKVLLFVLFFSDGINCYLQSLQLNLQLPSIYWHWQGFLWYFSGKRHKISPTLAPFSESRREKFTW